MLVCNCVTASAFTSPYLIQNIFMTQKETRDPQAITHKTVLLRQHPLLTTSNMVPSGGRHAYGPASVAEQVQEGELAAKNHTTPSSHVRK